MPLSKGSSQKSFVKNLKTELEHGKPMKQSLAIAYAMKRKSKKMAGGGDVKGVHKPEMEDVEHPKNRSEKRWAGQSVAGKHADDMMEEKRDEYANRAETKKEKAMDEHYKVLGQMKAMPNPKLKGLADGGQVEQPAPWWSAQGSSIAQGIANAGKHAEGGEVHKDGDGLVDRIIKRMSEGGKVANDTLEDIDDTPAQYDDLVLDDGLEPDFSGPGNEVGDEAEDDDQKDIVSRVMSSRRKKDRMPNPA